MSKYDELVRQLVSLDLEPGPRIVVLARHLGEARERIADLEAENERLAEKVRHFRVALESAEAALSAPFGDTNGGK